MSHDERSTPVGGDGDLGLRVFPEGSSGLPGFLRAVLTWHRLLHQREHPGRHEPGRPHHRSVPRDFAHFHDTSSYRRLHSAARPARHHLVCARRVPCVHDYLHAITLHGFNPPSATGGWDHIRTEVRPLSGSLTTPQVSHPAL